ncbi:MAG: S41 family peptidase [Firmicutes bacterium]|nr:S41 family peptidase [Bacillota bacterium]
MNKKISLGTAISIAAITAVFAMVITYTAAIRIFDSRMNSVTERQNMYQILSEIDITVRQNYYGEISENYLQRNISQGYIEGLDDKYSFYLSADEYQLAANESLGYTFGLGIDISKAADGNIQVNVVYEGSPAAKAGIVKGDVIVNAMGKDVLSVGYDKAVELISKASPKVSVMINRNGEKTAYELTKSKFETKSVARRMVNDNVGIITIYEFNAKTPAQFNAALTYLRNSGVKGIIIDLRDNSGINYEYACDILDTLLPAGAIMSVTDKNGKVIQKYTSDAKYIDLPMQVLINEKTEGAAELFAAVMMNYQKAETVGTTTAGHATVQKIFQLSNGGAVQLTVGTWSDSLGEFLNDGAVVPQFEVILTAYQQSNRYLLADEEDPQLQTALDRISLQIEVESEETDEEDTESTASV